MIRLFTGFKHINLYFYYKFPKIIKLEVLVINIYIFNIIFLINFK